MKLIKSTLTALILTMLFSTNSWAEPFNVTTKIKGLYFTPVYDSHVFVQIAETTSERPTGCSANNNFDFVINLNDTSGKEYYSALLTALTANRTVKLISYDSCDISPSVPKLKTLWLK